MKVLSNSTVYAIRALLYIASHSEQGENVSIKEISGELGISFHFLTKILQSLTQEGILESYRGPNGGIRISKSPEQIYLIDIVEIIEGEDFFETCLLGMPGCGKLKPCPVHDFWKRVKNDLKIEFQTTTLTEMSDKISEERVRLRI